MLWFGHRLDFRLTFWQLATLLSLGAFLLSAILLHRHFTDDALSNTWDYLLSVKVAVPPLAALMVTYAVAFLTGNSIADAPKAILRWIRNIALQKVSWMATIIVICMVVSSATYFFVWRNSPPSYVQMVSVLLGGENDDQKVVLDAIKHLKDRNLDLADRVDIARQVFEERRKWNHDNKPPIAAYPRAWVRALEVSTPGYWKDHPLRWHALAEAHSMLAQALSSTKMSFGTQQLVRESRARAKELYELVIGTNDPRATDLMKASARQNIANIAFYSGDMDTALRGYETVLKDHRSVSTEANRIAALILTQRFDEAVVVGNEAHIWAQTSGKTLTELRDYVSLLTNIGFLHLVRNYPQEAVDLMKEAFELIPDTMARQNLALALALSGMSDDADEVLATDSESPQVNAATQLSIVSKYPTASCSYLIRALGKLKKQPVGSAVNANLAAYLAIPASMSTLSYPNDWRQKALARLQGDTRPCGTLKLIPVVVQLLQKRDKQG